MKVVEPVFYEHYDDSYLENIRTKRQVNKNEVRPDHFDYEKCCKVLEEGIDAIKYNFSNN